MYIDWNYPLIMQQTIEKWVTWKWKYKSQLWDAISSLTVTVI